MKNYLCINGRKIELTREQVDAIVGNNGKKMLKDVSTGETFKISNYEFIVLEHSKETTAVILKEQLGTTVMFGNNNNFSESNVRKMLIDFASDIGEKIGTENLIEHSVDLTSNDGLNDYGKTRERMSLLTADLYRRYVNILDKHKLDAWWWLATPYSTATHANDKWVFCVSPSGYLFHYYCDYGNCGVRPFCILNSSIFVS